MAQPDNTLMKSIRQMKDFNLMQTNCKYLDGNAQCWTKTNIDKVSSKWDPPPLLFLTGNGKKDTCMTNRSISSLGHDKCSKSSLATTGNQWNVTNKTSTVDTHNPKSHLKSTSATVKTSSSIHQLWRDGSPEIDSKKTLPLELCERCCALAMLSENQNSSGTISRQNRLEKQRYPIHLRSKASSQSMKLPYELTLPTIFLQNWTILWGHILKSHWHAERICLRLSSSSGDPMPELQNPFDHCHPSGRSFSLHRNRE